MSAAEAKGMVFLIGIGLVGLAILGLVQAVITAAQSPVFWAFALVVLLGFVAFWGYRYYWNTYWPNKYFASEEFLEQKNRIAKYVAECNELNDHILELKDFQESIKSSNRGKGKLKDTSAYNFERRSWGDRISGNQVHNCSKSVVTNAQNNPFKYLCKYFSIKPNEQSLSDFEGMLNDFSAAEDGADCLAEQRKYLMRSVSRNIHPAAKKRHPRRLERELGFDEFIFDELTFPAYTFQYVSAGGNSSMSYEIEMDIDNIEDFVGYLGDLVKFKKSVAGQRALMTQKLRESIKIRDDYVCQMCGIDAKHTANLLLEIDHIVPLAKGGITSEDNLQTLCWKCNRSKGAKVMDPQPLPPPPP